VLGGCFLGYACIGLGGYASFRSSTAGNVLRNLDGEFVGAVASRALKFGYGCVILASVPTVLLPMHRSATDAFLFFAPSFAVVGAGGGGGAREVSPETSARLSQATAVAAIATSLTLALYVPNVEFAFGLTGSTCSFAIAFVFPALAYLTVTSPRGVIGAIGGGKGALGRGATGAGAGVVGGIRGLFDDDAGELLSSDEERCANGLGLPLVGGSLASNSNINSNSSSARKGDSPAVISAMISAAAAAVSPPTRRGKTEKRTLRRWRAGAKAQIALALILSYTCTSEVFRQLQAERALVKAVEKVAEVRAASDAIDKEKGEIAAAREEFTASSEKLRAYAEGAEEKLAAAQNATRGGGVDGAWFNATLAERLRAKEKERAEREAIAAEMEKAERTTRAARKEGKKTTRADADADADADAEPESKTRAAPPSPPSVKDDAKNASAVDEVVASLESFKEANAEAEDAKGKLEKTLGLDAVAVASDAAPRASGGDGDSKKTGGASTSGGGGGWWPSKKDSDSDAAAGAEGPLEDVEKTPDKIVRDLIGGVRNVTAGKKTNVAATSDDAPDAYDDDAPEDDAREKMKKKKEEEEDDDDDDDRDTSRARRAKDDDALGRKRNVTDVDVVKLADEKVKALAKKKKDAEREMSETLRTVTAEGVDEDRVKNLADVVANLQTSKTATTATLKEEARATAAAKKPPGDAEVADLRAAAKDIAREAHDLEDRLGGIDREEEEGGGEIAPHP